MVLSFFSAGGKASGSLNELLAKKKYDKAVELLRAEFKQGSRDPRLRLQLADVLVLAGKGREAVPILLGLADEFAVDGFAAKAISVLKKVQKIDPARSDVDGRLAKLIKEKTRDSGTLAPPRPGGSAPEFGMEEIDIAAPAAATAPSPEPLPPAPAEVVLAPAGLAEFQAAADQIPAPADVEITLEPEAPATSLESLGDDLLGVIEDVLRESPAVRAPARQAKTAVAVESPLFTSFSQEELVAVIRGLRLLSFEPGDILISEGEAGDSLFVLTSGIVKAFVRGPSGKAAQVREMEEGAFFGEISILSGKPRTATITAKTACELLELDRPTLDSIGATHPNVREVLQKFYDERVKNEQEARIRRGE